MLLPVRLDRTATWILATLLAAAPGCSDGGERAPDAGSGAPGGSVAWAVAGDFRGTGVTSTIAIDSLAVTAGVIAGVASDDPVARADGDVLYVMNRFDADNITAVDTRTRTLIAQISTGPGTNPQDVAAVGQNLYVVALASPGVLVLDLDAPAAGVVATIDLSELDPDDGIPDCNAILAVGERLYVSCGVLDERFRPRGPGKVAVIDRGTGTVEEVLSLSTVNPIGRLVAMPPGHALSGELLVATVDLGGLANNDLTIGCVERIRISSADSGPEALGCLVDNQELGGYASALAPVLDDDPAGADDTLYLIVTRGYGPGGAMSHLAGFHGQTRTLVEMSLTPAEQAPLDLAVCPTGELVIADAATGGIRIYEPAPADGGEVGVRERTARALDIGLPPVEKGLVCISASTSP